MAAFVISEVEVLDASLIEQYKSLAQSTIAQYGGRYVARGGRVEFIEGASAPSQVVIVEFPTMERAHEWYRSPEYGEALKLRETALNRRLIFVEGLPSS